MSGFAEFGGRQRNLKELIIEALLVEQPSSAKKIHARIVSDGLVKITYQGVFKTLQQLAEQGLLTHSERTFAINPSWATRLKQFGMELEVKCRGRLPDLTSGVPAYSSAFFKTEGTAGDAFYWAVEQAHRVREARTCVLDAAIHQQRAWMLQMDEGTYVKFTRTFKDIDQYVTTSGTSMVDVALLEHWRQAGWKCASSARNPLGCDTLAFGDFVIQVIYPEETRARWNELYSSVLSDPRSDLFAASRTALNMRTPYAVAVSRNDEFAGALRARARMIYDRQKTEFMNHAPI